MINKLSKQAASISALFAMVMAFRSYSRVETVRNNSLLRVLVTLVEYLMGKRVGTYD